jgi:hypothetical protein
MRIKTFIALSALFLVSCNYSNNVQDDGVAKVDSVLFTDTFQIQRTYPPYSFVDTVIVRKVPVINDSVEIILMTTYTDAKPPYLMHDTFTFYKVPWKTAPDLVVDSAELVDTFLIQRPYPPYDLEETIARWKVPIISDSIEVGRDTLILTDPFEPDSPPRYVVTVRKRPWKKQPK